jgi:hypothetical protein
MTITLDLLPTLLVLFYAVPVLTMVAYLVNERYSHGRWKWSEFLLAITWPITFPVFRIYNYLRKRRLYEYRVGTWETRGWYLRPGKDHNDKW